MKTAVIFFVALVVGFTQGVPFIARHGKPPMDFPHPRSQVPVWGTIVQKLDHFNSSDARTWNMRYLFNEQFYKPGGPIFIMLGGEGRIEEGDLQSGQMFDMAYENYAYMFCTEHRYYGESYPTSDLSTDNLKYLTTDLALHDVSVFIQYKKIENPDLAKAKVVVFGGSYAGSMSIWMREKYPDLVHAAVSSSAPILAKAQFEEYHQVVAAALGSECASVISKAVDQIKQKLITRDGQLRVQQDYNTWVPITPNTMEYWIFFSGMASYISVNVQYADNNTVNKMCSVLLDTSLGSEYERLAQLALSEYSNRPYPYEDLMDASFSWDLDDYGRQWLYQTCTQFGYYPTSSYASSLYKDTIPIQMNQQWCLDNFGPEFTPQRTEEGVAYMNKNYGGLNPNVTRVISIHGTVDPWHALGLSQDLNDDSPTFIVTGASHCADMYSISDDDSEEMIQAKTLTKDWVRYWLSID